MQLKKLKIFQKKGEHFQIFRICTVCMMQVLCEGGNISWTALHFFWRRFKLKLAHKSLKVGDMVGVDIKIFQFFLKNVQHFGGEKLIISGVGVMFFRFFSESGNTDGCRFGNNLGRRWKFFEKKFWKSVTFLGTFSDSQQWRDKFFWKKLERKGTVDGNFGNNPGRGEFGRIWRIGA